MKFVGKKRTIPIDQDYVQIGKLGQFWDEMRALYPNDFLFGLGTSWTRTEFDYYIGKVDQDWQDGFETVNLPDDSWHEFNCKENDKDIEQMYRGIYSQGVPDYEIESMKDGIFTSKVHFKNNKGKAE